MVRRFTIVLLLGFILAGCSETGRKGKIVFQSNRDGDFEIYSMNDDGTNLQRLTNSPAYDICPAWSPDGSQIVFASDRDGNWEIYTMKSDGKDPKRVTIPPGSNTSPSWAMDGTKILFVSTRDAMNGELYIMNVDGSDIERLTQDSTVKDSPVMSPDGRSILFTRETLSGSSIAVLNTADKSVLSLSPLSLKATSAKFSPDGSLIVFSAVTEGRVEVFTMAKTGENIKHITPADEDRRTPIWRGSNREIIYSMNRGLYVRSLDTGKEIALSSKGDSYPSWVEY